MRPEQFVAGVLISLDMNWRFDYERAMSFLDARNRSQWKRHRSGRPSTTWEQSRARAFGADWVARATAPTFGEKAMRFVHSVHSVSGFPTCELRYGVSKRGSPAMQDGARTDGAQGEASKPPRRLEESNAEWDCNAA